MFSDWEYLEIVQELGLGSGQANSLKSDGVGGKTVKKRPYKDLLRLIKDPFKSIVGELGSPT